MKETITRLKTIISLIENGEIKGESLNGINRFIDSITTVIETENPHLKIETEKSLSYREKLENLDKSLLLKKIEVNKILLTKKKEEILTQFDRAKNDTEQDIQLLRVNECVLENLQDLKSDKIKEKLLFSHWKIDPKDFLIDFQTNNEIWDYASTYNYNNIYHITALGLDVSDDFDGKILSLKEPQISIASVLMKYPFNQQILVFFVNRNNIYYSNDLQCINPCFKETKDIRFFKSILSKVTLLPRIKNLAPSNVDQQLLNLSKLFDKTLNEIY